MVNSLELYRQLYLIRACQQAIIREYPSDDIKTPVHMSLGQEHVAVGVIAALAEKDQLWTSYRTHAAFLSRTDDISRFFGELYGKVSGTAHGKAGSMHLASPANAYMMSSAIVGAQIAPAVGAAFANKYKKNGLISCVMFGDGALDEGCFWESLNVACVMKLPVLFVCEDNDLAVHSTRRERQGYSNIDNIVGEFDIFTNYTDSTDVEDIVWYAAQAVKQIHSTSRPAFLRVECYRYLEHVGTNEDFNAGYRDRRSYEEWASVDCVLTQRERLLGNGVDEARLELMEAEIVRQIDSYIELAKDRNSAAVAELYKGVFYANH